jgi:hypothetical protein
MSSTVQLTGGNFQSSSGDLLVNGYLTFSLSQDAQVNSTTNICAGREIKVLLNASGSISTSPPQYMWPNDVMTPANTFYIVRGYTSAGQLVWGPNSQQIFSTPSPYDVGAWKPNAVATSPQNVVTYDIGVFFPGQTAGNQLLFLLPFERQVTFAANMVPSVSACGTNPTGSVLVTLKKNGVSFGTLTVATSGVGTFSTTATTFNAGDVLTMYGPSSADSTWANIGITLSGTTVSSNS